MSKRLSLPEDPRWLPFIEAYSGCAERFAREVQGIDPSDQQVDLFASVSAPRSRTSVSSGHGTGKTTSIANLCLWHLLCFPQSNTLLTANDMDQLKATLWKEIGIAIQRIRRGPHAWLADHIEVLADGRARVVGFEDTWFIESKTANAKTANKMAGRHNEWMLVIVDEGSTVPDEVITTLSGALTEERNRMLITSQPTRNAGYFYRTHHDLSITNGGEWMPLVFSSMDSPFVSDEWLVEHWSAYDEDEKRVRILGKFPEDSAKHMMGLRHAEIMYDRGRIIGDDEPYGWMLLADIAAGEGLRDKSSAVLARVIGYGDKGPDARRVEVVKIPLLTNKIRSNVFSAALIEQGRDIDSITYVVDKGGLGVNVCQDLEDQGVMLHKVIWGKPCFKKENKERYLNLRAQAMHQAARAAKEGRISVLTTDHKQTMLDQSSRIPKSWTSRAQIKVPEKGAADWDGMGSPDLWDAICFAYIEGLAYVARDPDGPDGNGSDASDLSDDDYMAELMAMAEAEESTSVATSILHTSDVELARIFQAANDCIEQAMAA